MHYNVVGLNDACDIKPAINVMCSVTNNMSSYMTNWNSLIFFMKIKIFHSVYLVI
jgi:hypothetical protein